MATETHYVLARKSVPESAKYSSPNHESMDWHGIYRDLLFRRGTINPPCTHLKAEDSTTSFCGDPTSGSGLRKSPGCSPNGDHDDQLDQNVALFVKDFLSESAKARNLSEYEVAVVSVASEAVSTKLCQPFSLCPIPQICISEFEVGEDDEEVLIALCDEIGKFFELSEALNDGNGGSKYLWAGKEIGMISSLLLRIMLHRSKELKAAALQAFTAFISRCNHADLLRTEVALRVLELSEEKQAAFRLAAASLIPTLLQSIRRCMSNIDAKHAKDPEKRTMEESRAFEALADLKQRLLTSYVRLCGDKDCSVQLAAGQQLPTFVDCIAAEVDGLQQLSPIHDTASGVAEGGSATGEKQIGELMIAVYTATQKFTLSIHESCRMQGVGAVAAMARRHAAAFRALGNNFLPVLCSDSSWRVRATVCLALKDISLLFCGLTHGVTAEAKETAAMTGMTSLLFKFLTDRSPMVKMAALHVLPQMAELVGSTSFVRESWMLELSRIAEDGCKSQGSRLAGACLDALISIIPLSVEPQRRAFLELAVELIQQGSWKLKLAFLGNLCSLTAEEIVFVSPLISSSQFATDEEGDDCWRIHAALAQQLPVILNAVKQEDEKWWQLFTGLLLNPAWAVRQEAGFALRSVLESEHRRQAAKIPADSVLEQRLLRALREVASCKNAFIRQDVAFYLHTIPGEASTKTASKGLEQSDGPWGMSTPHALSLTATENNRGCTFPFSCKWCAVIQNELKEMLTTLSRDECEGVREEVSAYQ
ncbi:LOW QUALITY PROTEIN: hypothetical protein, conserved [Eimeria necatrix]|uniref:HEAT repeat-containing protein n=1 Tax=Eimeria necatrix TaxID=51315 RepID=U6MJP2_9EIME|nr:LOW QUALITY PROTEIN: hypothetical protein, conserved [Eimeria necatrix]CDJ62664.1 hypothetical protein, conserved [Eimeria necatrix]